MHVDTQWHQSFRHETMPAVDTEALEQDLAQIMKLSTNWFKLNPAPLEGASPSDQHSRVSSFELVLTFPAFNTILLHVHNPYLQLYSLP